MELKQLTIFQTAANNLNFTRTAEQLNYAQSNITAHIQALEEELGVPLFNRIGRQVTLTEAGRRLLGYTDKVLNLIQEAREAVSNGLEPLGSITISAPESLCIYRLPGILRQFHQHYPQVRLTFRPCAIAEIPQGVKNGQIDVAFVLEAPMHSSSLMVEPLIEEQILLLAPNEHRLTRLKEVRPSDLEGETFLFTEAGCSYRNQFKRVLAEFGIYPNSTLEFNSVEAIKQCVMSDMGLSVLPAMTVETEVKEKKISVLEWAGTDLTVTTQLLWHKDKWLSPALAAFINEVRGYFS